MEHQEYIRTVPGSDTAVLMIHGIAGSPAHFRDLLPVLPSDWSVYNILLDGHGGEVEDFAAASMKKWKDQVNGTLSQLFCQYRQVVLIAHSMGTLFAIQAAIDHPDKIPLLFLLNVPTRPWVRFSTAMTSVRVARGNISPNDHAALAMKNDTSIELSPDLFKYLTWLPRFVELLKEIRRVRKLLPRLKVPTYTFQSRTDELVSNSSVKDLENHPCIQNTVLYGSGHFAYGEEDARQLQDKLREQISQLRKTPINL